MFGRNRIKLKYNGEEYKLKRGDIPGLSGSGTITIDLRDGQQCQISQGTFAGKLYMQQIDREDYINGQKVSELIEKLEKRK